MIKNDVQENSTLEGRTQFIEPTLNYGRVKLKKPSLTKKVLTYGAIAVALIGIGAFGYYQLGKSYVDQGYRELDLRGIVP